MRNQKGITLVALVITIIVLLILAAVTIAALGGTNGILTNAANARVQNEIGEAKDLINLAVNEGVNDYYTATYVNSVSEDANVTVGGSEIKNNIQAQIINRISAAEQQIEQHGTDVIYKVGSGSATATAPTVDEDPTESITIQVVSQNRKAAAEVTLGADGTLSKWTTLDSVPTVPGE